VLEAERLVEDVLASFSLDCGQTTAHSSGPSGQDDRGVANISGGSDRWMGGRDGLPVQWTIAYSLTSASRRQYGAH
jgi:hypothetical protein